MGDTMDKNCQRERVIQYARDRFGTEMEYLWADTPDCGILRHPSSKKWYAIMMGVHYSKLGLPGENLVDVLNVKCNPIMIGSLLSEKGFLPAYHMNKNHWISIQLDETVADEQIFPLLEMSYDSVALKHRKRHIQSEEA